MVSEISSNTESPDGDEGRACLCEHEPEKTGQDPKKKGMAARCNQFIYSGFLHFVKGSVTAYD